MTMATEKAAIHREPIYLLKLFMDYCTLENGVGACDAVVQCYFTWQTCKASIPGSIYVKGSREYWFCNRGAAIAGAKPLLMLPLTFLPTKIVPDKFLTERADMRFNLAADTAGLLADPAKTTTKTDAGNFWPNFLARNRNYHGRIAELYQGFKGIDPADFELMFRGVINDMDYSDKGINIRVIDLLNKLDDNDMPGKIPDNIVVDDNPLTAGATTINLDDGSGAYQASDHFHAATANEWRVVKIENEYIIYTGINNDQLTGCTRGAFGTAAVAHVKGTSVKEVCVYAVHEAATAWADLDGLPMDHLFLDMICNWGKISAEYIETYDEGVTLVGAINDSVTSLTVSDGTLFPDVGVIKIGTELMRYMANAADVLTIQRGSYGSTAAAHSNLDPVYITTFSREQRWHQNALFKNRFESSKKVKDMVKALRQSTLIDIWQNEAGKIQARLQAPPLYDSVPLIFDDDNIIKNTKKVERNESGRYTRTIVYYNPLVPDAGEEPSNYYIRGYIDADAESELNYNEAREEKIYCSWICTENEASWLAAHRFLKMRNAAPTVTFCVELKDEDTATGDIIELNVPEIVDENGDILSRLYQVISKIPKSLNKIELAARDIGFGGLRYAMIAPSTLVGDYDTFTDEEKRKYAAIGNAANKVGAALEDGYYIF